MVRPTPGATEEGAESEDSLIRALTKRLDALELEVEEAQSAIKDLGRVLTGENKPGTL